MYQASLMSLAEDDTTERDNGFVRLALPRRYAEGARGLFYQKRLAQILFFYLNVGYGLSDMVVYLDRLRTSLRRYINDVSRLRSTLGNTLSICSGEIRSCAEAELLPSISVTEGPCFRVHDLRS